MSTLFCKAGVPNLPVLVNQHAAAALGTKASSVVPTSSCTSWVVELIAVGMRYNMDSRQAHLFLSSFSTTTEALLQLVRDHRSIEGSHWIRDFQLHEDTPCYPANDASVMALLLRVALNVLQLARFQSKRAGIQAVAHDIRTLLAMKTRKPVTSLDFESALPAGHIMTESKV